MNARLISVFAALLTQCAVTAADAADACIMNEIAKSTTRTGICRRQPGITSSYGCTTLLMRVQVADQFQQIELARRCGLNAEADKLEHYYKVTTPLVVSLYECIDTSIDRADIEKKAKEDVAKSLASLPPGCPADLKAKMEARLPKLIAIDEKSLEEVREIVAKLYTKPSLE